MREIKVGCSLGATGIQSYCTFFKKLDPMVEKFGTGGGGVAFSQNVINSIRNKIILLESKEKIAKNAIKK